MPEWIIPHDGVPTSVTFSGTRGSGTPLVINTATNIPYYLKGNTPTALSVAGSPGSAAWGGITGTLSSQTDLQSALDGKSGTGHNHTGTYQPVATVLTNTTASFTTALNTKLTGLPTVPQSASGFPVDAEGNYLVALTYDPTTRKVTLTPTFPTFDLFVRGDLFTTTGAHVSDAHSASAGTYFYYHNGSGFVWSTDPWPFDEAPICYVIWTGSDGVGYFELHTVSRDANIHRNLHHSQGTQVKTRGALSGYTLTTDSDAGVTWALAATTILDEDIELTLSAVADGGPYTVWYRTTAGAWTFSEGNTLPFLYGTYPRWNRTSDWTLQDISANKFGNYYVFATPAIETQQQIILIPGQAEYATLALAQAETVASLSYGTLPFQEIAALYKITLGAKNTYGGTAKTRIESVETLIGPRVSITVPAPVVTHNTTSGLQGGTTDEYYHLTAAQVASLGGQAFPVGSVFIGVVSTNPATLLGYGTWASFGAGKVMVGLDSGDTDFDTVEETGGAKTVASAGSNAAESTHTHSVTSNVAVADHSAHTHSYTEVVNHTHTVNVGSANDTSTVTGSGNIFAGTTNSVTATSANPSGGVASGTTGNPSATLTHTPTNNAVTSAAGSSHNHAFTGSATSVVQPYIVCYFWKRTA